VLLPTTIGHPGEHRDRGSRRIGTAAALGPSSSQGGRRCRAPRPRCDMADDSQRARRSKTLLDHLIAHRDFTWLGAEHDKVAHFLTTTSVGREELPRLTFGRGTDVTVRYFPEELPVGVSLDGRSHGSCSCCPSQWPTTSECSYVDTPNCFARCPPGRFVCSFRRLSRGGRRLRIGVS
jgi:hypothetical protein